MKKKRVLLFLLPFLFSCSSTKSFFPFGEKTDEEKPFLLFRLKNFEGNTYEDVLPSITSDKAFRILEDGESLSLFVSSPTCPSCLDLFPTFQEISDELTVETFSISIKEALQLKDKTDFLEKSTFGKGTPGWYLLKKDKVQEVLFGSSEDKGALKRKIKTTFQEFVSPYNAYRENRPSSFLEENEDFQNPTLLLDRENEESVVFYKEKALPFFKKNAKPFYVLDLSLFEENEKEEMKSSFYKEDVFCPIRYENKYISFEEGITFLDSYL